jgi:post-segregation antitoxin (ccd killing protein)
MARVNVYLPGDLAERAREAGLNVSRLTQEAVEDALAAMSVGEWVAKVRQRPGHDIPHDRVLQALDDARDELGA